MVGSCSAFSSPPTTCAAKLQSIFVNLSPQRAEFLYSVRDMRSPEEIPEVSRHELESVCREMKINKAPGIDGISTIALRAAIELFRQVFDACIQERMFPRTWKRQRLVLIPKGNNPQDTSGYSPLRMIDTARKLLQRIICRRLEAFLGEEFLSDHQFGFRFRTARSSHSTLKTHSTLRIGMPRWLLLIVRTIRTTYWILLGTTLRIECSYMTRTMVGSP